MMKKLFLAAQLLLGLGLTSCGQEDTPITHHRSTTGDRITLSVELASEAESAPRAMTISSGGVALTSSSEVYGGDYQYVRYRFARTGTSKAVFSQETTEPVTLVFYHGGKAYPVESQISLKNVNGHYRGDIEATLPAALSGVTRSDIQVAGVLGATSVDATTGKVTVTAPPAIIEGEEMQTMPMYFPKTALSASSTHLTGLRFKFLGTLIAIPVVAKAEISQQGWSSVKVEDQVFTPEVFTFGTERFTESQVEVDLSAGGKPTLTRTASSTYVHPLRETEVRSGDQPKTHILYVFPIALDSYKGLSPTIYGKYYPKMGALYDKNRGKEFVIPRGASRYSDGFSQGGRVIIYDMSIVYYNGDSGTGGFKGDYQKTDYSVFSGRDVGTNIPGRGWN
ncbi:hypothetical protein [Porphyromonas sp.]